MRGRHSYDLLTVLREQFRREPAPDWLLSGILLIIGVWGLGRGLDLALDPDTSAEIYAFADVVGANTWGWIQAAASAALLAALASRWLTAVLVAEVIAVAAWFVYGIARCRGALPLLADEGGLRNAFVPWSTASCLFIAFLATVDQMRRRIARDGRPE